MRYKKIKKNIKFMLTLIEFFANMIFIKKTIVKCNKNTMRCSDNKKSNNFKYSNVFDITNEVTHSQELLDATNILITDYSSCYIDYLLLDRPIIFYNFDVEEYKKTDRQPYFDYDKVTPGKKCITYTELKEEFYNLLNLKDLYLNKRKKFVIYFMIKVVKVMCQIKL